MEILSFNHQIYARNERAVAFIAKAIKQLSLWYAQLAAIAMFC